MQGQWFTWTHWGYLLAKLFVSLTFNWPLITAQMGLPTSYLTAVDISVVVFPWRWGGITMYRWFVNQYAWMFFLRFRLPPSKKDTFLLGGGFSSLGGSRSLYRKRSIWTNKYMAQLWIHGWFNLDVLLWMATHHIALAICCYDSPWVVALVMMHSLYGNESVIQCLYFAFGSGSPVTAMVIRLDGVIGGCPSGAAKVIGLVQTDRQFSLVAG